MRARRKDRLAAKAFEKKGLKGIWGDWRITQIPAGVPGAKGWASEIRQAWANNIYAVLLRPLRDFDGNEVIHLAIRTASQLEPPWRDLQRIKNEICGPETTAVQVMPPESELIDEADMYHIWVMESRLPFTIGTRRSHSAAVAVQEVA